MPADPITRTASSAAVLAADRLPSHDRGGGVTTTPLVGPGLGGTGFITGYTTFAPGAEVPFHSHNCEESVVLIDGEAVLEIDGDGIFLEPRDATFVPANVAHRFRNLSETKPMTILWIYATSEATRTLTATGEARAILAKHGQ